MARTEIAFVVTSAAIAHNLLEEFALHEDVTATGSYEDGEFIVTVDCRDTALVLWEVRGTVLTFDEQSIERHTLSRQVVDSELLDWR